MAYSNDVWCFYIVFNSFATSLRFYAFFVVIITWKIGQQLHHAARSRSGPKKSRLIDAHCRCKNHLSRHLTKICARLVLAHSSHFVASLPEVTRKLYKSSRISGLSCPLSKQLRPVMCFLQVNDITRAVVYIFCSVTWIMNVLQTVYVFHKDDARWRKKHEVGTPQSSSFTLDLKRGFRSFFRRARTNICTDLLWIA